MASNKISLLLFIHFLFSPTNEALVTYLHHNCSSTKTFSANTYFQSELTTLLSSLLASSVHTDFYNTTVVGGGGNTTVYGLFMCRGDVSLSVCHQCVVNATQRLSSECRVSKEAIIWYDECMIRYSNSSFFSTVDPTPRVGLSNTEINVLNQSSFMRTLYDDMNKTADEAAKPAAGKKKFATGTANFSGFETVYCLAQCTPDLTPSDCRTCLSGVIGEFGSCCNGKQGGRVMWPSCNVRYELYPFYQSESSSVPPTNTNGSQDAGKGVILSGTPVAIVVPISVAVLIFIVGMCCLLSKRIRKKHDSVPQGKLEGDLNNVDSLKYDFRTIESATNNFSTENELGAGGLREVYRVSSLCAFLVFRPLFHTYMLTLCFEIQGILPNGQEIAVNRLPRGSTLGVEQFERDIVVLANLQHRNLVKFLGFSVLREEEMILVYEYISNKSLDYFLFDLEKRKQLDWTRRYKIVKGIARGIQYLHEDSWLQIIHCDLKPNKILLDDDMNPKISGFDIAINFNNHVNEETLATRLFGTISYMSPEYAMFGDVSVKCDVYSFGIILMEIISGKMKADLLQLECTGDLRRYAWELWKNGEPLELLDPTIRESYTQNEVMRCIHISLLCVEEDPANRPSISSIVLMLENYSMTLPTPSQHE